MFNLLKGFLVLGYLAVAVLVTLYSWSTEVQPALFWINLMAPNPGDRYNVTIVLGLTFLTLMLPLVVVMAVILLVSNFLPRSSQTISAETAGIWVHRKKQLHGALLSVPISVNGKKIGSINAGNDRFFPLPLGSIAVRAGNGKQGSETLTTSLNEKDQPHFHLEIEPSGALSKCVLRKEVAV